MVLAQPLVLNALTVGLIPPMEDLHVIVALANGMLGVKIAPKTDVMNVRMVGRYLI